MKNATVEGLLNYYRKATNELVGIALATQGKTIKDLNMLDLHKVAWNQNVSKGIMKRKLNQLLKEKGLRDPRRS